MHVWQVAWVNLDTGLVNVWPRPATAEGTPQEWADRVVLRVPPGSPFAVIDDTVGLPDRIFRDAYSIVAGEVTIDMPKARVIHMERIRLARNAQLAAKDITFMRAVEAGDASAQSTIATEKQVLRDIPATFDITTGVTTPELLNARWPSELPARE